MSSDNVNVAPIESLEQTGRQDPSPTWGPAPTGPGENDENMEVETNQVRSLDWDEALMAIRLKCSEALSENLRGLSNAKRGNILEAVETAIALAHSKIEQRMEQLRNGASFLHALGLSRQELEAVLSRADSEATVIDTLKGNLNCTTAQIVDEVEKLYRENEQLKVKLSLLQESVVKANQMAASSKTAGNASTGERALSALALLGRRLKVRNDDELLQSEFQGSPMRIDGQARQRKRGSKHASGSYATPSSGRTETGEPSSLSSSGYSLGDNDSCASSAGSQVVAAFKAMLRAQSFGEVVRYDGKNSLVDFLRLFNLKYPKSAWNDFERRDVLVSLLEGQAKMQFQSMPEHIREGSFETVVGELRRLRRNPCERLRMIEQWDNLRIGEKESVAEFCCRMEGISQQIHSEQDRDFFLGSKLHSCLTSWKDSYHLLTELDAPQGQVYDSVRRAAIRLERAREAEMLVQKRNERSQAKIPFAKYFKQGSDKGSKQEHGIDATSSGNREKRCFQCGETGHYARKCPCKQGRRGKEQEQHQKTDGGVRKTNSGKLKGSFSAQVRGWCCSIREPGRRLILTKAYGKPCVCKVDVFGIKAQAIVDTGSIVSIVPVGLLKQAMDKAIDLDSMVTMMGDGNKHKVVDASGNSMDFLMLIATDLRVEGAGAARVQMHVQQSMDTTILLGTNALEPLNIRVQMDEMKAQPATLETTATVAKRVVVQPGRTAMIQVSGALADGDCVFWSENRRIMSGVCRVSKGVATVSAVNHEEQPWVIRKGETLGTWSTDTWIDPRTKEVTGDMLELTRRNHEQTRDRFEELINILDTNRRAGPMPQDLKQLVHEYKDVFAISDLELSHTNLVDHDIDVGGHSPIRQRTRPVPYGLRAQVEELLRDLKERGVIQESSSPWASPIVLVAKKDGSIRLCVDYREVNKVTKKDSYPLPAIDVTLQGLEGKRFFTSLDLASGYWQVPLTPEAREISAFTTTAGLFEFCVLPFGLTNAPAEFQRLMDKVLGELRGSEVSVYIDDILVATETMERHLVVLRRVFDALRRARLKLKPQKCRLMESKLEFLGHIVDQDGVWVDPDKVARIVEYPTPQNLAELRTFLGMAGYYRKFVLRFAHTAKPLYDLTSTKANFIWTEEHQKAFDMLKQHLTTAPVLAQPDVEKARNGSRPFYIYTDASRSGVGAVLAQEGDDGFLHPLHFASKALSRAERNYHVTDQEALAVIFAVQKFHYFIYGVRTIVRTDHASLTSLFRRANVSPRVLRWALELQRYDLHIEHVKGNANCVADALSRGIAKVEGDAEPTSAINEKVVCTIKSSEWLEELRLDPEFAPVVAAVEDQVDQEVRLPRSDKSFNTADFVIEDGRLKLIQADDTLVEVVPKEKRYPLFLEAHQGIMAGHFNAKKMFAQLKRKVFWPGMRQDLVKWCRECQRCFVSNPKSGNIPPLKPIAASKPFQIVGIDLLEMGPTTRGNRYIVTIIDHFTKYLGAYPIPDKKAETVAEALFGRWICDGGRWPDILLSDRGAEFENTIVASLCNLMGIQQHFTKGYCPRENGLTERINGTIVRMLKKKTVVPTEWDVILPTVVYAYNACPHEATGESPHFLLYGQDPKYPSEIIPRDQLSPSMIDYDQYKIEFLCGLKLARECIQTHSDDYRTRMKASYDSRWKTDSCDTFTVGDRVYVKVPMEKGKSRHPKLVVDWSGPYRVLEASQNSALVTLIGENKEPIRVQFDHLLKLPPYIDDTPVDTTTKRGKRGRRRMMGVHRCFRISLNRSHFRLPTTDPGSVDFTCPGSITRHGQQLYCRIAEPWKTFAPYAPLGDLVFPTVYEFARATSILQQSHISNDQKIAHILNSNYVILSSTALGFVLSAYRAKCYHFMQYMDGLLDPTTANTVHPPRSEDDPFDMSELYQQAISWAFAHPWNDNLWRQIRLKPTLVLLPQVFEEHVENFTAKRQIVKSYGKPKSIQDDWFDQEFSAVILFNPTEYSSLINWKTAWSRILMTVAEGADLFVLPGPKDDKDWGKSVDMLRDLCEETLALKPSLLPRLRCLLPTQSEMRAAEHPCEIPLKMMAGTSKSYSPHSVKVFFDMTQAFFGQYFSLKPFRCPRQEETTSQQRPRLPLSGGPSREALSYRQWKAQSRSLHREREPTGRHRSRSLQRRTERPRFEPYRRTQRSFSQRHGYHDHTGSSYRSSSYNQSHSYAHPSGRR